MVVLVVTGASIFLLLGVVHAVLTFSSSPEGGPLAPTSPDVRAAMTQPTGLGLAPGLGQPLWRAWLGFNYSHSLGVVAIAGLVIFHGLDDLDAVAGEAWFLVLTCVLPAVYLVLSLRYWFIGPTRGIVVGGLLLAAGTLGAAYG